VPVHTVHAAGAAADAFGTDAPCITPAKASRHRSVSLHAARCIRVTQQSILAVIAMAMTVSLLEVRLDSDHQPLVCRLLMDCSAVLRGYF